MFKQKIIILLLIIFLFISCNPNIKAKKNFYISLNSIYTVNTQGNTYVEHNIQITNLSPIYTINKYGLKVGSNNISDIKVINNKQIIKPEIVKSTYQTSIGIEFPDEILGEGKTREFSITYQNPDIAQIQGNVMQLMLPQMGNNQDYDEYTVKLFTPKKFQAPTRTNLKPSSISQTDSYMVINYDNPQNQGISLTFGQEQIYNFDLTYHLYNNTSQPGLTQIALPPDTSFQKVHYQQLDPRPKKINMDQDGNWIATYQLSANETKKIRATGQFLISVKRNNNFPVFKPSDHLQSQKFWETEDQQIQNIASKLNNSQEIYNYVVDNLNYTTNPNFNFSERLGAKKALENKNNATCKEFSDLFVTLSRANNIPARIVTGYAYSENDNLRPRDLMTDVLHAWAEYYDFDQNIWKPVDPTWGSTTKGVDYYNQFDLNHIVFAYNGLSSNSPYPVGSYKAGNQESKDIIIEFADKYEKFEPQLDISLQNKKVYFLTIPGNYELIIKNPTGSAFYNLSIQIDTKTEIINKSTSKKISYILPFQTITIPLKFYQQQKLSRIEDQLDVTILVNSQKTIKNSYDIKINSRIFYYLFTPMGAIFLGGCCIFFTLTTGSLLLFGRKK